MKHGMHTGMPILFWEVTKKSRKYTFVRRRRWFLDARQQFFAGHAACLVSLDRR
jgi:hypothetical protein